MTGAVVVIYLDFHNFTLSTPSPTILYTTHSAVWMIATRWVRSPSWMVGLGVGVTEHLKAPSSRVLQGSVPKPVLFHTFIGEEQELMRALLSSL